jgi:steroid delta-isomerase-like uncharacterized protein
VSVEANKEVVRRWYRDLWNRWDLEAADEIVHEDLSFRGSLGTEMSGVEALKDYVRTVRAAFPDFHNRIDKLVGEANVVVARLTYTGTHRGPLFGFAPTGRCIEYAGVALFTMRDGRVARAWVLGDLHELRAQFVAPE